MGQIFRSVTTGYGSYLLVFPQQYFQIGTQDFTVQYCFKPVYPSDGASATTNYLMLSLYDVVAPIGMQLTFGFMPDFGAKGIQATLNVNALNTKWVTWTGAESGVQLVLTLSVKRDGLMKLYINGNLVDSEDISLFAADTFAPTLVQYNSGGNPSCRPWNAHELDQFRLYIGRALTQPEIINIYGKLVVKADFAALVNDGIFTEFDDPTGAVPITGPKCSALVAGVWTDNIATTIDYVGTPTTGYLGYKPGGNPYLLPPVSSRSKKNIPYGFCHW